MVKTITSLPVLWDMTDEEIIQELARLEYQFGCRKIQMENGIKSEVTPDTFVNPYTTLERAIGLLACGIRRTLSNSMEMLDEIKKIRKDNI